MFRLPISSRALLFATLISALHSLLPPSATFASGPQGDRPQISIKKNYVAISVTVGAELKPLAEVFADCLSEGKAWANLVSRSAAAEWRDNRKAFRDELKWFYDRDYELRSVVGRYVSVVRSDDWFDGGAHPNRYIDAILWDSIARKRVSIRPFFSETSDNGRTMTAVAELAKLSVAAAKLANDINGYDDDDRAGCREADAGAGVRTRSLHQRWYQAEDFGNRGRDPCTVYTRREELRLDVSLFALRSRSLRGRNLYGLCSMVCISAIFVAAGRGALWRRTAKKR